MIMDYAEWRDEYPEAAQQLERLLADATEISAQPDGDEAAAQQQVRMRIAQAGGLAWRNNVGATPSSTNHICPFCRHHFKEKHQPVRYGLANDSARMNSAVKSADIVGVMPRVILPEDVGETIGQFIAVEVKRPGWDYTGKGRETAQAAFLSLVQSKGGAAQFSTGEIQL